MKYIKRKSLVIKTTFISSRVYFKKQEKQKKKLKIVIFRFDSLINKAN